MSRQFSGASNSYLYSGAGDYLAGLSAITITGWVYRTSGQLVVPLGCGLNTGYLISLYWWTDDVLYMDVRNGVNKTGSSSAMAYSGWNHIAGTFDGSLPDGSRYNVFCNGDNVTALQTTGQPTTVASYGIEDQSLRLGRIGAFSSYSSSGTRIAYVQVFNVALPREDIRECMRFPMHTAGRTTCLNCWPLDTSNLIGEASAGGGVMERDLTQRRHMDSYTTTYSSTNPPIMVKKCL